MKLAIFISLACIAVNVHAADKIQLTGNLSVDLLQRTSINDSSTTPNVLHRKSEFLAAVMSAVLPGAGQAYVGNWDRAALFFLLEAAGLTATFYFTNAGDKQTIFFQNYADGNINTTGSDYVAKWDVVKYAEWVNTYVTSNNIDKNQVTIDADATKKPWDRVDWSELNTLEQEIGNSNSATGFSHQLPTHGQQQYYELIGKYPQFGHGWDDATASDNLQTAFNTPHLLYYSNERGQANSLYAASQTALIIVILNHIASAIEGVTSAHAYNKMIQVSARTEYYADGSFGLSPRIDFHIPF